MATKKQWIPIVVGIAIFVVLVGAGLLGGFIYLVARQVDVQEVSEAGAQAEFDRLLAGMAGQTPFIEVPEGDLDRAVVHREMQTKDTGSVSTVRVRVWSPRERKLVRVDLPFWMLRLTGGGGNTLRFDAGPHHRVKLRVTPEDIDRRGPGLLLNYRRPDGDRLLVWTE
jgi:hypothetical protein